MRPDWDEYFLRIAEVVAQRSTCGRRAVGCVLVDGYNNIISTGYNGPGAGLPNCSDESPCEAMSLVSGFEKDFKCQAVHAEANALIFCMMPRNLRACYVTTAPCVKCTNMLLNTPCERVVAREINVRHVAAIKLWESRGRLFKHLGQT
jgi:dCMP deaminase